MMKCLRDLAGESGLDGEAEGQVSARILALGDVVEWEVN